MELLPCRWIPLPPRDRMRYSNTDDPGTIISLIRNQYTSWANVKFCPARRATVIAPPTFREKRLPLDREGNPARSRSAIICGVADRNRPASRRDCIGLFHRREDAVEIVFDRALAVLPAATLAARDARLDGLACQRDKLGLNPADSSCPWPAESEFPCSTAPGTSTDTDCFHSTHFLPLPAYGPNPL